MASNGRRIKLCEFGKRGLFSLLGIFSPTDVITNFLPLIKGEFFSCRTFSLSLLTFCPHGRVVPPDVFSSGRFVPPDVCSHGHIVAESLVAGRFVAERFVWEPTQILIEPGRKKLIHLASQFEALGSGISQIRKQFQNPEALRILGSWNCFPLFHFQVACKVNKLFPAAVRICVMPGS